MAGAKEIRTKTKSVQNTQKITRAMEMVAGSKMRKAKERMNEARPYALKMRNVIAHQRRGGTDRNSEASPPKMFNRASSQNSNSIPRANR